MISDEQEQRWKSQIKTMFSSMREGVAAGDSIMTTLPVEYAKKQGVSQFVRIADGDEGYDFLTGPRKLDRRPIYKSEDRDMFAFVDDWASGRACEVPDYMLKPCPVPEMLHRHEKKRKVQQSETERGVFMMLSELGVLVTLVNPSFGTMAALKSVGGQVFLTSNEDHSWKRDVDDFISGSGGKLRRVTRAGQVSYLGVNSPQYYTTQKWFYLIPSPYSQHEYDNFSASDTDHGVKMTYEKDGRSCYSEIADDLPLYVYSPSTVGVHTYKYTKQTSSSSFFLVSNFPIPWPNGEVECTQSFHRPWFLSEWPDEQEVVWAEKSEIVRMNGNIVYDVRGDGTYQSRRARIVLPQGFFWAPVLRVGMYSWTRYSKYPILSQDFSLHLVGHEDKVVEVSVFGNIKPVYLGDPVYLSSKGEVKTLITGEHIQVSRVPDQVSPEYFPIFGMGDDQYVVEQRDLKVTTPAFVELLTGRENKDENGNSYVDRRSAVTILHSFVLHGKTYVVVRPEATKKLTVFSDMTAYKHYRMFNMINLDHWAKISPGITLSSDITPPSSKTPYDRICESLSDLLIHTWTAKGRNSDQIVGVCPSMTKMQVYQILLNQCPTVVLWRDHPDPIRQEFVLRSAIKIRCDGKVDQNMDCIDGRTVVDTFDYVCLSNKTRLFCKSRDISYCVKLAYLLRQNGFVVQMTDDGRTEVTFSIRKIG